MSRNDDERVADIHRSDVDQVWQIAVDAVPALSISSTDLELTTSAL